MSEASQQMAWKYMHGNVFACLGLRYFDIHSWRIDAVQTIPREWNEPGETNMFISG